MTTQLKALLQETIAKTSGMGFEVIRIQNTADKAIVESSSPDRKTVLYKAVTNTPIEGLSESVIGLSDLNILSGVMSSRSFRKEGSSTSVKLKANGDVEQIILTDDDGMTFRYRVMAQSVTDKYRLPVPMLPDFDVEVSIPSKDKLREMNDIANLMKSVHPKFVPQVSKGNLDLLFGGEDNSLHNAKFTFVSGLDENQVVSNGYCYPIEEFQRILGLAKDAMSATIKISDEGLIVIEVVSDILTSTYLLSGHTE